MGPKKFGPISVYIIMNRYIIYKGGTRMKAKTQSNICIEFDPICVRHCSTLYIFDSNTQVVNYDKKGDY